MKDWYYMMYNVKIVLNMVTPYTPHISNVNKVYINQDIYDYDFYVLKGMKVLWTVHISSHIDWSLLTIIY